jgi:hypothetical protein
VAHRNKVMQSIDAPGGGLCVDVFCRPDGSFGFDEFRRDPEDPRGWFSVGHHGDRVFASAEAARAAADRTIPWLADLSRASGA